MHEIRCSACGSASMKFYRIKAIYNYPELREDLFLCPECQRGNRLITYLPMAAGFVVLFVLMLVGF